MDPRHRGGSRPPTPRAAATSSGRSLAGVFAWLRPNDLIWNYWVTNYLLGKDAARVRHPVLERGHDQHARGAAPRLPAARARELARPAGRARRCWARRSTSRRSRSTPTWWRASPTTSRRGRTPTGRCNLLGSEPRFVLSTSGHIAALVNPPGNEKATYRISEALPDEPEEWLAARRHDPGVVVGRLDRSGWASAPASGAKHASSWRQGPAAARRRARRLRAG